MHVALTGIDEQVSGDLLEQEGADSCSHSADSCDCSSSLLGKEVSADGIKVGRPALVRCSCEAYADHGEPGDIFPNGCANKTTRGMKAKMSIALVLLV